MPRLHSYELVPDAEGAAAVVELWRRLSEAGLPSQSDHKGMSNAVHLTLLTAPALTDADDELAYGLLAPLLPVTLTVSGLVLLGSSRVTVALLPDVPDAVAGPVRELRAGVADLQHPGWLPHVTLGRRIPASSVPAALAALGSATPRELRFVAVRRWDPDNDVVRELP